MACLRKRNWQNLKLSVLLPGFTPKRAQFSVADILPPNSTQPELQLASKYSLRRTNCLQLVHPLLINGIHDPEGLFIYYE